MQVKEYMHLYVVGEVAGTWGWYLLQTPFMYDVSTYYKIQYFITVYILQLFLNLII